MTPEEFVAKLEELRAVFADKLTQLEEEPKWGSPDQREEIVNLLEDLVVQAEGLTEALQSEIDEDDDDTGSSDE
jgi:hypothetical protein